MSERELELLTTIDNALAELLGLTGENHISAFIIDNAIVISSFNGRVDYYRKGNRVEVNNE